MARPKKYTREQLTQLYLNAEKKANDTIHSTELGDFKLPNVSYYNMAFKSWNRFLMSIGKPIQLRSYRKKKDPNRYLSLDEYSMLIDSIDKLEHKIQIQLLCYTGMKIEEARRLKVSDIDLSSGAIEISGLKRDKVLTLSDKAIEIIKNYVKEIKLSKDSTFNYPTQFGFNKRLKSQIKKIGILDYEDFSATTLLNTFYMGVLNA